jgi:hypothetical protein
VITHASGSFQHFGLTNTLTLGIFIVVAAVSHALLSTRMVAATPPLRVDTVVGDILVREQVGVAHHKCNGFKIECYESFVVVYVDKKKEPSWTGNYVLTFPWSKIEHLTMAGYKTK